MSWATLFVKLFQKYSPSGLKLPKLHNWCYHIITSIKEYGAINGFTTETYESLHKDSVKKPYRASNKRNATDQMIKTVSTVHICIPMIFAYFYINIIALYRFTVAQ